MTHIPFPPMQRPLVAILRGLRPDEADSIVGVLIECGLTAMKSRSTRLIRFAPLRLRSKWLLRIR